MFSPSLPALAALLPSSLPASQGHSSWGSDSGELSGTDLRSESADKRPVLQTWAGIVTPWLAQQEGLLADKRRFSLRQLGVLPARLPSHSWTAVPRKANLYSQCFGWSLMLRDSVPWQSTWDRGEKHKQRAQPAASDGKGKQGRATAAVRMLPIRKSLKPLCVNGNTPCSWNQRRASVQASPAAAQPFTGVLGQVASRVRLSLQEQLSARTWQLRACFK